ncbi:hypothetical protein BDV26DRAFT_254206 [Aspergillus bertholletiae]|uniref:Uncharacterized protein n=1 Tax=Aspergillus bertholletiae TaxID=1226010 RepID=A0A5N7BJR9_9EURO|nr:hypothetical protein BDV26DRAFT_254206 [Aspergillus bertholletiae]
MYQGSPLDVTAGSRPAPLTEKENPKHIILTFILLRSGHIRINRDPQPSSQTKTIIEHTFPNPLTRSSPKQEDSRILPESSRKSQSLGGGQANPSSRKHGGQYADPQSGGACVGPGGDYRARLEEGGGKT